MPRKAVRRKTAADTDISVVADESLTVVNHILECRKEADDARKKRLSKNRLNVDMFLGEQDFSYKQPGQSTEFLPKMPIAVEQMCAFVKRGLVQFGDWFSAQPGKGYPNILTPEQIRELMKVYLNKIATTNNKYTTFPTLMTDAVKSGLLESLIILKVHGFMSPERAFSIEPGEPLIDPETLNVQYPEQLVATEKRIWRPRIDLVRAEDYYPDPTGRGLYEIHEVERDISAVVEMADAGIYDASVLNQIEEDFTKESDQRRTESQRGQSEAQSPDFRKRIVITEYWGSLLDSRGRFAERNIVCALANRKYLIRKPEPNPFWHGESPFVAGSILRVPHSVWHKALYDHASQLNVALNEIFNLMLDGGLAQVWGIKQIRIQDLADPSQVSGGIPQGTTLAVKNTLPYGNKVIEQVSEGEVPPDAKAIYEMLSSEFAQAALSNELKLGGFPQRNVKATEVIEQSQSQAVTLDSITADIENDVMGNVLRKLWLTILQNADDLDSADVTSAIGPQGALTLARLTEEQRFVLFHSYAFRVYGLSETLSKARDFQKLMALLQVVSVNPIMLQAFYTKYSPDKTLEVAMKALNINPSNLQRTETEAQGMAEQMKMLPMFMQMAGGQVNKNTGSMAPYANTVGESEMPAEINQMVNPMTGMTGNQ